MFSHLTVIELANVLAGPSVGMFLAELGATVIKVENLHAGGDVTRNWKLPSESEDTDISAYFSAVNWGKKSIALDLKQPKGQQIVHGLCEKSDMVLTSFLPATAKKLNMEPDTLRQLNPTLIVAEINGYGVGEERAAYDAIIQAEAGFTFLNGEKGKGNVKMPVALMDLLAGHQLKEALLLAIINRMQTGTGSYISASLLDSGIASLANQATNFLVANHSPKPLGSDHPNIVPYGTVFYTADQKAMVLAIGSDAQFATLCKTLDIPPNPNFQTSQNRVVHKESLLHLLSEKISTWPRTPLLETLAIQKVPAGAVNEIPEVMTLPQAKAMQLTHDSLTGMRTIASQMEFSPKRKLSPPPHLGEHGKEILREELGWEEKRIVGFLGE